MDNTKVRPDTKGKVGAIIAIIFFMINVFIFGALLVFSILASEAIVIIAVAIVFLLFLWPLVLCFKFYNNYKYKNLLGILTIILLLSTFIGVIAGILILVSSPVSDADYGIEQK